jgi:hypothetical protein
MISPDHFIFYGKIMVRFQKFRNNFYGKIMVWTS